MLWYHERGEGGMVKSLKLNGLEKQIRSGFERWYTSWRSSIYYANLIFFKTKYNLIEVTFFWKKKKNACWSSPVFQWWLCDLTFPVKWNRCHSSNSNSMISKSLKVTIIITKAPKTLSIKLNRHRNLFNEIKSLLQLMGWKARCFRKINAAVSTLYSLKLI